MLNLDQIDLEELADLMDQRDDSGYLDPKTGEIYPVYDGVIIGLGEDGDPIDAWAADTEGFIALGGEGGRDVYRDMEHFASWVGDRRIRQQLTDALEGHKPMRAFRSVVHSTPEMLGPVWERFRNLRGQLRALDFLGTPDSSGERLVAEAEVEARRAHVVQEADTILEGLGGSAPGRLILLNGLPGVGKSALARAYVATRPGALNLDIDILRTLLGGPWEDTAEAGRSLALTLIESHLDSGHEVVVPQLVADRDQLKRFEEAAGDAEFVVVLLEGEPRRGDQPWQQQITPQEMDDYRRRLEHFVSKRAGVQTLQVVDGDPTATLADLERLLGTD